MDAVVFEKAALLIEQNGWWGGRETDSQPNATCISNAVAMSLLDDDSGLDYQARLIEHFNLVALEDVFKLNDSQSDEDGQDWAITNLRTIAREIWDDAA